MGSGCTINSTNFSLKPTIPDTNVLYTGPAIPALGICQGDSLSEIEAIVLSQIINFSQGIGIDIPNINLEACALFQEDVTCCNGSSSVPKDLNDLMSMIFTALCTLYTDYTTLQATVTALLNGPYNTGCLTGLTSNPTLTQIIQALITQYCALNAQVQTLQGQVTTITSTLNATIGNFLLSHITSCQSSGVTKSGTGATAAISFQGFTPIGGIIELASTISYAGMFDSSGLGLSGTDMCGWALANGNTHTVNGITVKTVDKRGNVGVGAINGMGGGTLPSYVVDPSAVYSPGDTGGEVKHQLVTAEIPNTPVTINDPGHEHALFTQSENFTPGDSPGIQATNPPFTGTTFFSPSGGGLVGTDYTHITASIAGGNGSHENRMPYQAALYIQRLY